MYGGFPSKAMLDFQRRFPETPCPQRTPCDVVKVAWAPVGTGAGALLLTGGSDGRVQASKNSKIGEVVGGPMEPQKGWLFFRYFV